MKYPKTALAAVLVACMAQPAHALDLKLVPDNWTKKDTAWQIGTTALLLIDAGQTADIRNHDDIHEVSPLTHALLGDNPGRTDTAIYFTSAAVIHYAVAAALPPKYRRWYQGILGGVELGVTAHNYQLGLRWGF